MKECAKPGCENRILDTQEYCSKTCELLDRFQKRTGKDYEDPMI